MNKVHMIFYVQDQEISKDFYVGVLESEPTLHVPGMTEFHLNEGCVLGLMPESGIKRLLGESMPDPSLASGIPRAELYLQVGEASLFHERALAKGGVELSAYQLRDWGAFVAYCLDPDGHVLAFAQTK